MIKLKDILKEVKEMPESEAIKVFQSFGIDVNNISSIDLKKIYRKLATELHPDKERGDLEKMKLLNVAYETLKSREPTPKLSGWPRMEDIYFTVSFSFLEIIRGRRRLIKKIVNVIYIFEGVNNWLVMMGPSGNTIIPKDVALRYKVPDGHGQFYYPNTQTIQIHPKWKRAIYHVPYTVGNYAYFELDEARDLVNNLKNVGITDISIENLPMFETRISAPNKTNI